MQALASPARPCAPARPELSKSSPARLAARVGEDTERSSESSEEPMPTYDGYPPPGARYTALWYDRERGTYRWRSSVNYGNNEVAEMPTPTFDQPLTIDYLISEYNRDPNEYQEKAAAALAADREARQTRREIEEGDGAIGPVGPLAGELTNEQRNALIAMGYRITRAEEQAEDERIHKRNGRYMAFTPEQRAAYDKLLTERTDWTTRGKAEAERVLAERDKVLSKIEAMEAAEQAARDLGINIDE